MVHALGDAPDGSGKTVYVVEPHANAVFADARLPFDPRALALDIQPDRPTDDRQDLLALSESGAIASVDVGSHAFAWRIPGVVMGAFMAGAIYLLARTLFRRRTVGLIAALLVLVEGMAFANSRIAMNDTYVATFVVGAVALFAPIYLGIWRRALAVALVLPLVGVLLGLALGTKWVGAYAIGLVVLLFLLRSALGRSIALAGMIALTGSLGYLGLRSDAATAVPHLNITFLLLMLGLTLLLGVAMVIRPVRATLDELRFAVLAPAIVGGLLVLAGLVIGPDRAEPVAGPLTPNALLAVGAGLLFMGALAYGGSWLLARWGIGPLAVERPPPPGGIAPSPAPTGWLRPGSMVGIPWLYALVCLTLIPIGVYVVSYLPWVALGNRLIDTWPDGNTGQTLWDLTLSMYRYHNDLRAGHAASSPWWAWPFDLKPVWFYQDGFAGNMTGVIYDTGNLVIFWLAIPAVAFAAWQAWVRRSLALTLVVLGVIVLWVPWARIDRATFQYHVFTSLPFAIIALAYFLAELWHGSSSRTFLLARAAGALAIIGPPVLWLMRKPLCSAAGTEVAHPNGVACGDITRSLTVADNVLVSAAVAIAAVVFVGWLMAAALRRPSTAIAPLGPILVVTALATAGVAAAQLLFAGQAALTIELRAEEIVLAVLLLLCGPAFLALRARDARRWVVGAAGAAALFFLIYYPNLTGMPMPNSIAPAYLGLLPTWNYDFQFAVNLDAAPAGPISYSEMAAMAVAAAALCAVAMVAARWWRADRRESPGDAAGRMVGDAAGPG
jgi:predicted membrane-bound dolichyl-phosphate-mannose-protein mannosyltransferase